jgi:site-specific DNA recombinase
MKAALYPRVSTQDQNCEAQYRELDQYVRERGWIAVEHYSDTMSGTKAERPELARLLADARARKFQVVLVWKLDRFGRSALDLDILIGQLEGLGGEVHSHHSGDRHRCQQPDGPVSTPGAERSGGA